MRRWWAADRHRRWADWQARTAAFTDLLPVVGLSSIDGVSQGPRWPAGRGQEGPGHRGGHRDGRRGARRRTNARRGGRWDHSDHPASRSGPGGSCSSGVTSRSRPIAAGRAHPSYGPGCCRRTLSSRAPSACRCPTGPNGRRVISVVPSSAATSIVRRRAPRRPSRWRPRGWAFCPAQPANAAWLTPSIELSPTTGGRS